MPVDRMDAVEKHPPPPFRTCRLIEHEPARTAPRPPRSPTNQMGAYGKHSDPGGRAAVPAFPNQRRPRIALHGYLIRLSNPNRRGRRRALHDPSTQTDADKNIPIPWRAGRRARRSEPATTTRRPPYLCPPFRTSRCARRSEFMPNN